MKQKSERIRKQQELKQIIQIHEDAIQVSDDEFEIIIVSEDIQEVNIQHEQVTNDHQEEQILLQAGEQIEEDKVQIYRETYQVLEPLEFNELQDQQNEAIQLVQEVQGIQIIQEDQPQLSGQIQGQLMDLENYIVKQEHKYKQVTQLNKIVHLPINLQRCDSSTIQSLIFLDEPGLNMHLASDHDIPTLLQWFLPRALLGMCTANINDNLKLILQREYSAQVQFEQDMFEQKKFDCKDILRYFGINILFAIQRFPSVNLYWHNDQYLTGGIDRCMQEGRYKFIESHYMKFLSTQDYVKAIYLTDSIRKKWRQVYKPDQELIFYESVAPTYTTYYLLDSQTLYILDEVILFPEQSRYCVQKMLMNFCELNHVLYFSTDSLDIRLICQLADSAIYPIGQISIQSVDEEHIQFINQFTEDGVCYFDQRMCYVKENKELFVCPIRKIRNEFADGVSLYKFYLDQQQLFLEAAKQMVKTEQDFKSYSQGGEFINILFEQYLESTLHNIFCLYDSILIHNDHISYKQFKLTAAAQLIGSRYLQLGRDRQLALQTSSKEIQTEFISFGLPSNYKYEEFHLPSPVERTNQVKYCIVCMKYQNTSKSYFTCLLCLKQYGKDVYLCIVPCFGLFHQHPDQFNNVDYSFSRNVVNEQFYTIQSESQTIIPQTQLIQQPIPKPPPPKIIQTFLPPSQSIASPTPTPQSVLLPILIPPPVQARHQIKPLNTDKINTNQENITSKPFFKRSHQQLEKFESSMIPRIENRIVSRLEMKRDFKDLKADNKIDVDEQRFKIKEKEEAQAADTEPFQSAFEVFMKRIKDRK